MTTESTLVTNVTGVIPIQYQNRISEDYKYSLFLVNRIPVVEFQGETFSWPVKNAGTSDDVTVYSEGADISSYDQSSFSRAYLSPLQFGAPIRVSDQALSLAQNSGDVAVDNLWQEAIADATRKLLTVIDTQIITGTGSSQLFGLQSYTAVAGSDDTARTTVPLANASGAYAGITRTTTSGSESWYASHINKSTNANTDLTQALMDELEQTVFERAFRRPNLIVCSPQIARKYGALFASTINRTTDQISTASPDNLYFQGMPVLRNPYITNVFGGSTGDDGSYVLALNTNGLRLFQQTPVTAPNYTFFNPIPGSNLKFGIAGLSKTGFATKAMVTWLGGLAVLNPREHGILHGIK